MIRKFVFAIILLLLVPAVRSLAQTWDVPEDQKGVTSPFLFTPETQKKGEAVYQKNCVSCHGQPGQKNWAKITPEPGDPASEKFQKQTDGEFFYRVTTGKIPMPTFGTILSEEDRWNVISFIRTFHPGYKQPKPGEKVVFSGKTLKLAMEWVPEKKKIRVTVKEVTKEKQEVPFKGAEVVLTIKRYFGSMNLADPKTTGESGIIQFDADSTLPGDKAGNIEVTAKINAQAGQVRYDPVTQVMPIGVPTDKPSLIATRAWWSVRSQAPVWLIITFFSAVLTVWGLILYILWSVIGIRKLGTS
jgi:hypothetical protein